MAILSGCTVRFQLMRQSHRKSVATLLQASLAPQNRLFPENKISFIVNTKADWGAACYNRTLTTILIQPEPIKITASLQTISCLCYKDMATLITGTYQVLSLEVNLLFCCYNFRILWIRITICFHTMSSYGGESYELFRHTHLFVYRDV